MGEGVRGKKGVAQGKPVFLLALIRESLQGEAARFRENKGRLGGERSWVRGESSSFLEGGLRKGEKNSQGREVDPAASEKRLEKLLLGAVHLRGLLEKCPSSKKKIQESEGKTRSPEKNFPEKKKGNLGIGAIAFSGTRKESDRTQQVGKGLPGGGEGKRVVRQESGDSASLEREGGSF